MILRSTLLLALLVGQEDMARKNAEAELFRAETRADLARLLMERFIQPVDAWIAMGGPKKALPDEKSEAAWFLLLIETKPRVLATPIEYRFCLDLSKRRMVPNCYYEHEDGKHEDYCHTLEDLETYAKRTRNELLNFMVDDCARHYARAKPKEYNLERLNELHDFKRCLIEGEAYLYPLVTHDQPVERAALKERRLY